MRAEEYFKEWIVKHPDPYALLTGKPFADEFIKKSLIGFAEAYHKSKVEAISDDVLNTIELYDSLVEFKGGNENCILPEHYKDLSKDIIELLKQ